jgi:hypothetical protein
MKRTPDLKRALVADYSAARAQAIKWLGDRYLLAKPINAERSPWRKLALTSQQTVTQQTLPAARSWWLPSAGGRPEDSH